LLLQNTHNLHIFCTERDASVVVTTASMSYRPQHTDDLWHVYRATQMPKTWITQLELQNMLLSEQLCHQQMSATSHAISKQ